VTVDRWPREAQSRPLFSLRHMYATFQIVYGGTDLHLLARQMGNVNRDERASLQSSDPETSCR
jgi:hypothetical protein